MIPEHRIGRGQVNLNTVLLAVCVGLSGWALKSISDLQEQVSGIVPVVTANSSAIMSINQVNSSQTNRLEELANRLTKVETVQSLNGKN